MPCCVCNTIGIVSTLLVNGRPILTLLAQTSILTAPLATVSVPRAVPSIPLEGINSLSSALRTGGLAAVVTLAASLLLARFLPDTPLFRRLVLITATRTTDGYGASVDTASLIGQRGTAVTPLRPGGNARFGEQLLSVVTRGDFIESGTSLVIVETHGNRLLVEPATEETGAHG